MPGVWAQLRRDFFDPIVVVSVTILAAFLAVSGPFGSYVSMDIFERLAFWVPCSIIGSVLGLVIGEFVDSRVGPENERRASVLSALFSALVMTLPLTLLINQFMANARMDHWLFLEAGLLIFSANLGICSLRKAWEAKPETVEESQPAVTLHAESRRLPPFVSRLPVGVQAPVALITGRNHHIDIETDKGSADLLMRFSDAVLQMDPIEGMQVHRSYWVAYSRMRSVEKFGQRHFMTLTNGNLVPISKNNVELIRQRLASLKVSPKHAALPLRRVVKGSSADPLLQAAE